MANSTPSFLDGLVRGVINRLHDEGFHSFRTVVLTVRFEDFVTKSRAHTLTMATDEREILKREAMKLMLPFLRPLTYQLIERQQRTVKNT